MLNHTRSIADKVFEVWCSPGRFTKNPDVIALPNGRLLLVYSDTDAHWAQESEILTILCSDDQGGTWRKLSEVAVADQRLGDERLVTPRLSYLSDGRLVVLCDHDDYSNFHEDQPSGNWLWSSSDGGQSWSSPHVTGILGIEPDRVMELPDGALGVGSHLLMGESQEFAEILTVSTDGGETWNRRATIAHNGYHRFCEGAIVLLDSGEMACILRENHSGGIPNFVAFSTDHGYTWTAPAMLPFAIHRPYARQLADGRVLVAGRNVNGGLGCYAWCGNLREEAGSWQIGGPRRKYTAHLTDEALTIENRPAHECRYTMLPPESSRSEVHFEAEIRVDGPTGQSVAFLSVHPLPTLGGPCVLEIASDSIGFGSTRPDRRKRVDMTQWRTVGIHHCRGLLEITVDGSSILHGCVFRESPHPGDFHGGDPARRTQFGQMGDSGLSHWRRISYEVKNPTLPAAVWDWEASKGLWPDQYQRDRMIQIHGNHPDQKPWPDHGYSSWLPLPDGRIFLVDYSNHGDPPGQSHLVGLYIDPEDLV